MTDFVACDIPVYIDRITKYSKCQMQQQTKCATTVKFDMDKQINTYLYMIEADMSMSTYVMITSAYMLCCATIKV